MPDCFLPAGWQVQLCLFIDRKRSYTDDRHYQHNQAEETNIQESAHARAAAEARSPQDRPRSEVAGLYLAHPSKLIQAPTNLVAKPGDQVGSPLHSVLQIK